MTFQDFQQTAERVTTEIAADRIGMYADDFGAYATAVWLYDETIFITEIEVLGKTTFHVLIGRDDWNCETREQAERILYLEFYVSECVDRDAWTLESLTELYGVWLDENADKLGIDRDTDAAEARLIVTTPAPEDRTPIQFLAAVWLEWFGDRWEKAEERA